MTGTQTPVTLLTGFLGAGKTTLLNALLQRPELSRSAVVVNEFGEIGIDHLLVEAVADDLLVLTTGCICCAARGDLVEAIDLLFDRRHAGLIQFDRIVVETTGIADPGPILEALSPDRSSWQSGRLAGVVTVVDALSGTATLDAHAEARRQVALADVLVLSKTDLGASDPSDRAVLEASLQTLNPAACILIGQDRDAVAAAMAEPNHAVVPEMVPRPAPSARHQHHHGDVEAVCLTAGSVDPILVEAFIGELFRRFGNAILRLKGLVASSEDPGSPIIVQAVGARLCPAERLKSWPTGDHGTRLVVIMRFGRPADVQDLWASFFSTPTIDQADAAGIMAWQTRGSGLF